MNTLKFALKFSAVGMKFKKTSGDSIFELHYMY